MNAPFARTLVVASAILATAAGAKADPVQVGLSLPPAISAVSPVRVNRMTPMGTKLQEYNMMPGYIVISFTNESSTPATDVVFGLVDKEKRTIHQYDQSGTFAQGIEIVKQLPYDRILDHQLVGAEVVEVTFADGSVWEKPAPIAPVSRRQATYLDASSVPNNATYPDASTLPNTATYVAQPSQNASYKVQTPDATAVSRYEQRLEPAYPGFNGNPNN